MEDIKVGLAAPVYFRTEAGEKLNSLRKQIQLPESKSAVVLQVIGAAIEAGLIEPDERVGTSRKLARYLPFWAGVY